MVTELPCGVKLEIEDDLAGIFVAFRTFVTATHVDNARSLLDVWKAPDKETDLVLDAKKIVLFINKKNLPVIRDLINEVLK